MPDARLQNSGLDSPLSVRYIVISQRELLQLLTRHQAFGPSPRVLHQEWQKTQTKPGPEICQGVHIMNLGCRLSVSNHFLLARETSCLRRREQFFGKARVRSRRRKDCLLKHLGVGILVAEVVRPGKCCTFFNCLGNAGSPTLAMANHNLRYDCIEEQISNLLQRPQRSQVSCACRQ